jgi:hypothetical protein
MRVKVSLMGDVCLPQPATMTIHDGLCFEMPTPMMWPPGLALQQNKLTTTVFHKAQFVALEGHDCGYVIPHVTIPLANPKLPLYIAFSSRKVMFASSKVKANGAQIGCTELLGPHVPLPMLCCGSPVSIPNGFPSFNWLHTVSVGLSIGDVLAGFTAIAIDVFGKLLCGLKWFKGESKNLAESLVGAGNVKQWVLKNALSSLSGAARLVLTGEGKLLRVEAGSGYAGIGGSVEHRREGRLKVGAEAHTAILQGGDAFAVNPDGTASNQWTASAGTPLGTGSIQHTTTYRTDSQLEEETTQTTLTGGAVDFLDDGPGDTGAVSRQHTTTLQANGHATSTTTTYAGSSSPAGSWGMPL